MNWYKISKLIIAQRQQLMFYPWQKYDPETGQTIPYHSQEVLQRLQPLYSNPLTGENFYRCAICGQNISESDIAVDEETGEQIWVINPNQKLWLQYEYPETINQEKLLKEIENIYRLLYEAYEDFTTNRKPEEPLYRYGYEDVPIPNVKAAFYSSEEIQKYCLMKSSIGPRNYYWERTNICGLGQDDISSRMLIEMISDPSNIENNISKILEKILENIPKKEFSVPVKYPICNKCYDKAESCEYCNKKLFNWKGSDKEHILNPEHNPDAYPVVYDYHNYVCRNCVEDGYMHICEECGYADVPEDMYATEEGMVCQDCFKNYNAIEHWMEQIDEAADNCPYPFKSWFPEGENRIYFSFVPDENVTRADAEVISFLRNRGCKLNNLDYQEGYCFYGDRKFKIGKILRRFRDEDKAKGPHMNWSYEDLLNSFMTSSYRKLKNTSNLMVAISQDPNDIAAMSTGRKWISCMHLGRTHGHDVFDIIKAGSLIAYLIRKDDKDIENPLARITIRRFENEQKNSLAVPEEHPYGTAPSGFYKAVRDWLQTKQRNLPIGEYKRVENAYSDTLGLYHEKSAQAFNKLVKLGSFWYSSLKFAKKYELV